MPFGTKFLCVPCSLIEKWGLGRFTESVLACCHTNQFAQGNVYYMNTSPHLQLLMYIKSLQFPCKSVQTVNKVAGHMKKNLVWE